MLSNGVNPRNFMNSRNCKGEVGMPAYEYLCNDCKKEFTVFLSIKEFESKPKINCPHCQSDNVMKKLTAFFAKTSKKS
jgi:putative FmdB family regulatory protein